MPDKVEYFDADHRYVVNGEEYPSVSTVLGFFVDFSRVPKDVLAFKRQIGRATHKAIELFESGELDMDSVDEAVMPYLNGWMKFRTDKPNRVIAAERIVYSKKHRYAGRLDLAVELLEDGTRFLLDVKCTYEMPPATSLQTAAYAEAFHESEGTRLNKRAGLQLKPDGSYELYPFDRVGNRNDFNYFLNALNLHRWMRNNRRAT